MADTYNELITSTEDLDLVRDCIEQALDQSGDWLAALEEAQSIIEGELAKRRE